MKDLYQVFEEQEEREQEDFEESELLQDDYSDSLYDDDFEYLEY